MLALDKQPEVVDENRFHCEASGSQQLCSPVLVSGLLSSVHSSHRGAGFGRLPLCPCYLKCAHFRLAVPIFFLPLPWSHHTAVEGGRDEALN